MKLLRVKALIAMVTLTGALLSEANCTLNLKKKKITAKTAVLGDTNLSGKVLKALASKCELRFSVMTQDELIQLERAKFEAKVKKLQGK